MTGLTSVNSIRVPRAVVLEAHAHLRRVGVQGEEGFALWVGDIAGETFHVRQCLIPKQTRLRLETGVCVIVGPEELHRVNVWLYETGLTLVAQLHSHPGRAYHSGTDEAFPIATTAGSISIVVPNFASKPFSLARCAVFRLGQSGGWDRLPTAEVWRLVEIVE